LPGKIATGKETREEKKKGGRAPRRVLQHGNRKEKGEKGDYVAHPILTCEKGGESMKKGEKGNYLDFFHVGLFSKDKKGKKRRKKKKEASATYIATACHGLRKKSKGGKLKKERGKQTPRLASM